MVPAFVHRESQECREALDPRDQLALRAHPARKDPREHVGTEEIQGNLELKAPQAPRDLQGHWGRKELLAQRAQKEPRVTPGIKETRDLKEQQAK